MKKHFVYVMDLNSVHEAEQFDNIHVKQCLQHFKNIILESLNMESLLSPMIDNNVLNLQETTDILKSGSRLEQNTKLINILEHKDNETFWNFINVLKTNQHIQMAEQLYYYMKEFRGGKKMLNIGKVPIIPQVYIHRQTLQSNIKTSLITIPKSDKFWILVCGFTGCGKSTECAAAVHDVNIMKIFTDGIFWIKFGTSLKESDILDRIVDLINRLQKLANTSSYLRVINDIETGKQLLFKIITEKYPNVLFILDDIHSKECIQIFDINRPVLVISRDCKILADVKNIANIINFNDLPEGRGFSLSQTETLLKNFMPHLKKHDDLYKEFVNVHKACKGSPMILSSTLEKMQTGTERSLYTYQDNRVIFNVEPQSFLEKKMSKGILFLEEPLKELFFYFAVFPKETKIPYHLLSPLWKMKSSKVNRNVGIFVDKCLLWKEEFGDCQIFYNIHPLLHLYIKHHCHNLDKGHRRIVNYYSSVCDKEWHKLPQDGYIFKFMDYHILKAGMINLAVNIFSDFQFLQIKIRETSADAVINIVNKIISLSENQNIDNFKNVYAFLLKNHLLLDQPDVDIIQLGLLEDISSYVYQSAMDKMIESTNTFYTNRNVSYEILSISHKYSKSVYDKRNIFSIFDNGHYILASNVINNDIDIINIETGTLITSLSGHTGTVRSCNLTRDKTKLLSCSSDHTARQWNITSLIPSLELNDGSLKDSVKDNIILFESNSEIYYSQLSEDNELILLISQANTISVINISQNQIIWEKTLDSSLDDYYGCFSSDNKLIAVKAKNKINIFEWESDKCIILIKSLGSKYCFYSNTLILCSGEQKHSLMIQDVLSGDIIKSFYPNKKEIERIALGPYVSQNRHFIAATTIKISSSTGVTETIYIWSVYSEEIIYICAIVNSSLRHISFSNEIQENDTLFTLDTTGHLQTISIKNDDLPDTLKTNESILALHIKSNNNKSLFFITSNKEDLCLWKIHHINDHIWTILEILSTEILSECYMLEKSESRDVYLVCAFKEGQISVYNIEQEENPTIPLFAENIKGIIAQPFIIAYESSLDNLALALEDSTIYISWLRHSRNEYYTCSSALQKPKIVGLRFLKEFFQLLVVFTNYVGVCNTTNGKMIWIKEMNILNYDVSRDKLNIALCLSRKIKICLSETGETLFEINKDATNSTINFSPSCNFLVYKSEQALKIIDWKILKEVIGEISSNKNIKYIQFAIESKIIMSWDGQEMKLYSKDLQSLQCLVLSDVEQMRASSNFETFLFIKTDGRIIILEKIDKNLGVKNKSALKSFSPFIKKRKSFKLKKTKSEQLEMNSILLESQSSTEDSAISSTGSLTDEQPKSPSVKTKKTPSLRRKGVQNS